MELPAKQTNVTGRVISGRLYPRFSNCNNNRRGRFLLVYIEDEHLFNKKKIKSIWHVLNRFINLPKQLSNATHIKHVKCSIIRSFYRLQHFTALGPSLRSRVIQN